MEYDGLLFPKNPSKKAKMDYAGLKYSKQPAKKKTSAHKRSILQPDKSICYLCGRNGRGDALEEHHIFGGPLRSWSEAYGLKVYICGIRCHREGKDSVHKNKAVNKRLKTEAREAFLRDHTKEEFKRIFGRYEF